MSLNSATRSLAHLPTSLLDNTPYVRNNSVPPNKPTAGSSSTPSTTRLTGSKLPPTGPEPVSARTPSGQPSLPPHPAADPLHGRTLRRVSRSPRWVAWLRRPTLPQPLRIYGRDQPLGDPRLQVGQPVDDLPAVIGRGLPDPLPPVVVQGLHCQSGHSGGFVDPDVARRRGRSVLRTRNWRQSITRGAATD